MLINLTIEEISEKIRKKQVSFQELIQAYHSQYKKFEFLNVAINQYWDEALEYAKFLDNNYDENAHILRGIPISIKDMYLIKGKKLTAASKVLENFIAPYESHVTSKLIEANYIMPFKANLDEFAMGSSNKTSAFGPVINPWILEDGVQRVPGGSSGGSAASVAAKMCLASLGTDTGGSVRQPSAFCGLVGLKPSYGRISRRGIVAFASSLDHPGIFSRNVQDACIIFDQIAGYDKYEATSLNENAPNLSKIASDVKNKVIGIDYKLFDKVNPEYKKILLKTVQDLKNEGAIIKELELPSLELSLKLYYIIAPAEAASNLSRYDGLRYGHKEGKSFEEILLNSRNLFGTEVKRRILIGNFVLLSDEYDKYYGKAYKLRIEIKQQMEKLFENIDAFILPTTPSIAFPLNEQTPRSSIEMYFEDLFTIISNIYGGPAIQVPIGKVSILEKNHNMKNDQLPVQDGLPVGLQIMAKYKHEEKMIAIAKKVEEIVQWKGLEL